MLLKVDMMRLVNNSIYFHDINTDTFVSSSCRFYGTNQVKMKNDYNPRSSNEPCTGVRASTGV